MRHLDSQLREQRQGPGRRPPRGAAATVWHRRLRHGVAPASPPRCGTGVSPVQSAPTVTGCRPLRNADRCGTLAVAERWPLRDAGRCGTLAVAGRWPLRNAGRYGMRAAAGGRCPSLSYHGAIVRQARLRGKLLAVGWGHARTPAREDESEASCERWAGLWLGIGPGALPCRRDARLA